MTTQFYRLPTRALHLCVSIAFVLGMLLLPQAPAAHAATVQKIY